MKPTDLDHDEARQQRSRRRRGVGWLALASGLALGVITAAVGTAPGDDTPAPARGLLDTAPADLPTRSARAAALDDGVDWQHVVRDAPDVGASIAAYETVRTP